MAGPSAPLAILAALGAALVLAASGAGGQPSSSPAQLGDNVGLRAGISRQLDLSIERSCPPPAVLACGPGVRLTIRVPGLPSEALGANVATVLARGLRAAGFRDLTIRAADHERELSGRVTSHGEVLGRWRLVGSVLEVTAGGLDLRPPAVSRSQLRSVSGVAVNPAVLRALWRDLPH
jgi:hypothetical protein